MRRDAAWADSVGGCWTLERVREAMGASDVLFCERVRVATGYGGGVCVGGTLVDWCDLGVGMW